MKKKAIFHNIIGGLSNFGFIFFTTIFLLPYYFTFINNEDYGIWLGGISFISLASIFEANLSLILTQQLAKKLVENKLLEFSKYLTAAIFFSICTSIIIILGTYFFKENIFHLVSEKEIDIKLFSNSFFLYSISLSLTIIAGYLGSVFQVYLITIKQPIYSIIASFFGVLCTVILVSHYGVLSIAIGYLVKSSVYLFFITIGASKILKANNIILIFSYKYLRKLLKSIGLPFISKLMMTSTMNIQNFIISLTIGSSITTIYDITKKLPLINISLINIIAMATFTSFSLFYSEVNDKLIRDNYTRKYFDFIRVLLFVSLTTIFIIGKDFIRLWVGLDKFAGIDILGLICVCCLLDQLRLLLAQQYYANGKINLTSLTDSIYAILFIIITIIILPVMGLKGIILAGIFSNLFYFAVCKFFEIKNKINVVAQIITKTLFIDIIIVSFISFISYSILRLFPENIFTTLVVAISSLIILIIIYYNKEKTLINFIINKFIKPLLQTKTFFN